MTADAHSIHSHSHAQDLVAAVEHALNGNEGFVWVDIFAVRQWPGNDDVDDPATQPQPQANSGPTQPESNPNPRS